jgi:hypothetical protein
MLLDLRNCEECAYVSPRKEGIQPEDVEIPHVSGLAIFRAGWVVRGIGHSLFMLSVLVL